MSKVAVVYWSSTGNTEAMANAVADGIREKGGADKTIRQNAKDKIVRLRFLLFAKVNDIVYLLGKQYKWK